MSFRTPGKVAYINARLLDPASGLDAKGGLLADGELIVERGPDLFKNGAPDGADIIDCGGACLAPGLVDMRVQLREPGEEHKETLASAGAAAVAGGVTSMVCLPNTEPVIDDIAAVEFVARIARKNGLAKVYPYAAATKGLDGKELAEIGMLAEAGALGFTDGTKAIANALMMRRALSYAATFGLLIIQHPEEPSLADGGAATEGELATRLGLPAIPAIAEAIQVARDIALARLTGGHVHFAHVSTAAALDLIRVAKAEGLRVTCDTAPPYFDLNEIAIGEFRTYAKLSPPLRAEADRRAVVAGLADGTIDAVASDHQPRDADDKRQPFALASAGGAGLMTLLPITLAQMHGGAISLPRAVALMTAGPAQVLGLPQGQLMRGGVADLCLFHPERAWKIEAGKMPGKAQNTPFDGRAVEGRVIGTWKAGRRVFG